MSELIEVRNGRVVTPDAVIEDGRVVVAGSRIVEVGSTGDAPLARGRVVDADGLVVLPGLIDLHGDDIEHELYPRSGARVDPRTALMAADRYNVCAGITTKFHAVAFEDAPSEDRSLADAAALGAEIAAAEDTLGDNRLHARCELDPESVAAVESFADDAPIDLLSVMHHAPDDGQYDAEAFRRHYAENRDLSAEQVERLADDRASTSAAELAALARRVATVAADAGAPLASHDDETPADVERMAAAGATISEYPLTERAARRARERGMATAMGAPNLVRGGSLWDNLSARRAVEAGVVDAFCADYHPPSLLATAFVDTGEPLYERAARVTANPADAAGLHDRGRLERGARADLILVDPNPVPTVEYVLVGCREAIRTQGGSAPEHPPRSTHAS